LRVSPFDFVGTSRSIQNEDQEKGMNKTLTIAALFAIVGFGLAGCAQNTEPTPAENAAQNASSAAQSAANSAQTASTAAQSAAQNANTPAQNATSSAQNAAENATQAARHAAHESAAASKQAASASMKASHSAAQQSKSAAQSAQSAAKEAKSAAEEAKEAIQTAGATANVTQTLNAAFQADSNLNGPNSTISVQTSDGVVHLTGTASSVEAKQRAGEVAQQVLTQTNSPNKLSNEIVVQPAPSQP
jgi:osmotically-inducible protein OsmY